MDNDVDETQKSYLYKIDGKHCYCSPARESSLMTLIKWNIDKALEKNQSLNLEAALKEAEKSLRKENLDVSAIKAQRIDERYLSCALLAWQQIGHHGADSLYSFLQSEMEADKEREDHFEIIECKEPESIQHTFGYCACPSKTNIPKTKVTSFRMVDNSSSPDFIPYASKGTCLAPVVKIPHSQSITVMRLDMNRRLENMGRNLQNKIEQACCQDEECVNTLMTLDKSTKQLKARLGKLASREANRVELLERAETAWFDLEAGYMRRHRAVMEKEDDLKTQIKKLIEERQNYKDVCGRLIEIMKPRGDTAEQCREKLKEIEDKLCKAACERLKLSEMAAHEDSLLADAQCKQMQQDRDLKFKEEQAVRKLQIGQGELDSARGLAFESERALRAELTGLRNQIKQVSKMLLNEEDTIENLKKEIDNLRQEKKGLVEDLEGCQESCDANMQKTVDKIMESRAKLQELKAKVMDCKCKVPIDVSIEVKRTPSLAAQCFCEPEDRALAACSCTSLRTSLMLDLLRDLFGGLHSEMNDIQYKMPCQLLKCLEDRHNWDKPSIVKNNLRKFFASLLSGELDIAIVNSIERYHAKWVGASCVDICPREIPDYRTLETIDWEDRSIARKAHKMALGIADEMFKEKVDEIMQQAKDVLTKGAPPCDCPHHEDCPNAHVAIIV